jgi:site-specific DNA-methyltransferase (adenine-specific)/modification methylase
VPLETQTIGKATLYRADCREVLPIVQHKDQAILTDPPYGINIAKFGGTRLQPAGAPRKDWDRPVADVVLGLPGIAPAIIWGGNYYSLPPTRGFLVWHKPYALPSMADCELAWTPWDRNARLLTFDVGKAKRERVEREGAMGPVRHPTQKPVRVFDWSADQFERLPAILDPFMGTGTAGVVASRRGVPFIGCEMDAEYFDMACKRLEEEEMSGTLI